MSRTWHYGGMVITTYVPGDPEPDATKAITASGRWYKNGRGWQHELALTDMGDLTWDEMLENFGEVHVRDVSDNPTHASDLSNIPAKRNMEEER